MKPYISLSRARVRADAIMIAVLMAALAACSDNATEPNPQPVPPPDTATYDLVFEESLFPLNASVLRIRRKGETTHTNLFGLDLSGIEPSASANGQTLVYQGFGIGIDDSDLFVVRPGQQPQRVPLPTGEVEYAPALSPDGAHLAYIRLGEDGNTQLWVSRLDGTERRMLSTVVAGTATANSSPDWSPNGQRIAWATGVPGALRIAVINADGTGLQTITAGVTTGTGADIDADWSPDGTQIAFIRGYAIAHSDLAVVTVATKQERTFGYPFRSRHPHWAPDGKSIVFSSNKDDAQRSYELYTVKPDGSSLTRLTNDDLNQRHPLFLRR